MVVSVGQVLDSIRHRIGGPIAPELGGATRVLNLAGRWLDSAHSWRHRLRVSAQLDFTNGDTFLALPTGFKSLIAAEQPSATGLGRRVHWVSPAQMLFLRNQAVDSNLSWDLAVSLENTGTVWQLGLYQVPSATESDVLRISYMSDWTDVTSDSTAITIPDFMEPVLIEAARAYALGLERGDLGAQLAEILAGPVMYAAKLADGAAQPYLGQMAGGAVASHSETVDWYEWMRHTNV